MAVHRIRLGSAWRLHFGFTGTATLCGDAAHGGSTFQLPARGELLHDISCEVSIELRRSFNRPTNLAYDQRVRLVIAGLAGGAEIVLNESSLSSALIVDPIEPATLSFEIANLLRPHNELTVLIPDRRSIRSDTTLLESVWLEIESDLAHL